MIVENISTLNFKAGLSYDMKREISNVNISQVTSGLQRRNIDCDFKNSKVIGWAAEKCVLFFEELRQRFGVNIPLPRGIFVEDFNALRIEDSHNCHGFCNAAPTELYKDTKTIVPEKTIFFNKYDGLDYWENIDSVADILYQQRVLSTDFFLEIFLHEFNHAIHIDHLIQKLGGHKYVKQVIKSQEKAPAFEKKYSSSLAGISDYACTNPMDAVATDLSKREVNNINQETMLPENNFFIGSPYEKKNFFDLLKMTKTDRYLHNFWNGHW